MIPTRTVNDCCIRPVPLPAADTRPVLGADMLPLLYSNTAIIARKKSGKTMLLYRSLEACTDRRTKVILIAPTAHKDPTYTAIQKMLHRRRTSVSRTSRMAGSQSSTRSWSLSKPQTRTRNQRGLH